MKLKHISLIELSNVDKLTVEGQEAVLLCNYLDVYKNEKITSRISFMQASASDEQIKRLSIRKSDVLLTKDSETPEDIGVPAIVAEELDNVVCGYHLALARPNPRVVLGEFLFRAIQAEPTKKYYFSSAVGMTRYGLDKQAISDTPIPLPALAEQITIADYLDHETAKLDAMISAKEELLELLVEKRRALITHAVTRGLNPNVRLRDSGVEWLGEIPEHWNVRKLKLIAEISYGVGDELDKSLVSGVPLISLPNVSIDGVLDLTEHGWTDLDEKQKSSFLLRKGDLLFNWRNGSSRHLGKTAYFDADGEWTHVGFLLRIRFDRDKYQARFFQSYLGALRITGFFASARAMVNNTFNQTELENLYVVVPPLAEQEAIAEYLEVEIKKLDDLTIAAQETIALLRERRTALIAAAVTGQIRVTS